MVEIMKIQIWRTVLTVLLLTVQQQGLAAVIVDTGVSTQSGGLVLSVNQWTAGYFRIDNTYRIDNISTNYWGNGEEITFALYADQSGLPGTEIASYVIPTVVSDTTTINTLSFPISGPVLSTGNYWASFEVRNGQTFSGGLQGGSELAFPNPLEKDAFWLAVNGFWRSVTSHQGRISLTIEATAVPLPSTVLLFGSGILLLATARKDYPVCA